jgi:hypothetical protein
MSCVTSRTPFWQHAGIRPTAKNCASAIPRASYLFVKLQRAGSGGVGGHSFPNSRRSRGIGRGQRPAAAAVASPAVSLQQFRIVLLLQHYGPLRVCEWRSANTWPPCCCPLHVMPARLLSGATQIRDIGSGNFGVAKLMRDRKNNELVAVKFIQRGDRVRSACCDSTLHLCVCVVQRCAVGIDRPNYFHRWTKTWSERY